jgi:thioredoxin reductase (NADPH)
METMQKYDVVIVGCGPAGMTSAIYTVSAGLKTLLTEKAIPGGQIVWTESVENYPGFENISGKDLADKMLAQAKKQGAEYKQIEVNKIIDNGKEKIVETNEGNISCKVVIISVGSSSKKLNVPGEKEYENKGVHYCALCDGPMYKEKIVAVIGGGDAAIKEGILLSNLAKKVYIIHRRDELRAEKRWQEKAFAKKNIEFIWDTEVKAFEGDKFLRKIKLINNKTNKESELIVDGCFTYVGQKPNTDLFDVEKNEKGYIKVDHEMSTSAKGIFAAGDCTEGDIAQLATSVGDGAIAGTSVSKYIESLD